MEAPDLSLGWVTYLRVSDEDKQTPERSFAMQRQRIQEHLLAPSELSFKKEYLDLLSGGTPNRSDYQLMLKDAQEGKFSHLGLYRADRFGRNAVEGLQAATKLISYGIKLRVANMPSLQPETPDGFFMFLLQMGLAQREVDVLRQRTQDGMEVKLKGGGWPHKAPEGYINKERMVKSNKYDRWVEVDPRFAPMIRKAWDLLLTDRFTLDQICEELSKMGYTRPRGLQWVWNDSRTGRRLNAKNRLSKIYHNPFYAGWAVSEKFGILQGQVKGQWTPSVSQEEYDKGQAILKKHDRQKSRQRRVYYLLKGLLSLKENDRLYKLNGSTPSGYRKSYSYYITQVKVKGKQIHIPCDEVDSQILSWLQGIAIKPERIPAIRDIYQTQLKQLATTDREKKVTEVNQRLKLLREEEGRLGRLFMTQQIGEDTYQKLREEWKEKLQHAEINLSELERNVTLHLDDLDTALLLLTKIDTLYSRLTIQQRSLLLQIFANRIIVNAQGEIIEHELNPPFMYLSVLHKSLISKNTVKSGSEQVSVGAHKNPL